MIIKEKIGNLNSLAIGKRTIDLLPLQWYETSKRILHLKTASGTEVALRFLNNYAALLQDDVVYEDAQTVIAVDIQPCAVIVLQPKTSYDMAVVCYEIGNKHLPLFYEADLLLMPFDAPVFRMLEAAGFNPILEKRRLLQPLKTSVSPHAHEGARETLFSKILKLTTSSDVS